MEHIIKKIGAFGKNFGEDIKLKLLIEDNKEDVKKILDEIERES